jgi:hypothetical protein
LLRPVRHLLVLSALILSGPWAVLAQQNTVPLDRDFSLELDRASARLGSRMQTGLKPVVERRADLQDVLGYRADSTTYYYWHSEKLYRDHLLILRKDDVHITADPLFQFEFGHDFGDRTAYPDTNRFYHNIRGFWLRGDIGPRFSFETMFLESQAVVPQYLFLRVRDQRVVSGQGRSKIAGYSVLDYGWSQASISYAPASWMHIQFGHGRHFAGHGYRSMLLSDHAPPAPYLKFSVATTNRMLQYSTWHSKLQHGVLEADRIPTGRPGETLFYWMRSRTNHLSLALGRLDLALFESTIFRNIDADGIRKLDPMELNPVIGLNTLQFGFNGEYHVLVGADLRLKVTNKAFLYGQVATNDPGQRTAWQAGVRLFDVVRRDIHLQVEYNHADPFMYMHDPARLAYMHSGLPMAHPFGAHFQELVGIADLGLKRWRLQVKVNSGTYHLDPMAADNVGSDLRKPLQNEAGDVDPQVLQLTYWDSNISHLFNPKTNLRAAIGFTRRDLPGTGDGQQASYLYISLRTGLFNRYYDL